MRLVLLDRARQRRADIRGGGQAPLSQHADDDVAAETPFDILALDQVMTKLSELDPDLAKLAELHLLAGLEIAQIAQLRGLSERTLFRDWRIARMALIRLIGERG